MVSRIIDEYMYYYYHHGIELMDIVTTKCEFHCMLGKALLVSGIKRVAAFCKILRNIYDL